MRHGKKFNHLGRTAPHRKAMLSNMAASLIIHKRITTTVAKAKALKKYVEPLITKANENKLKQIEVLLPILAETERKQYLQSIEHFFNSFYAFSSKYYGEKISISAKLFDLRLKIKGLKKYSYCDHEKHCEVKILSVKTFVKIWTLLDKILRLLL